MSSANGTWLIAKKPNSFTDLRCISDLQLERQIAQQTLKSASVPAGLHPLTYFHALIFELAVLWGVGVEKVREVFSPVLCVLLTPGFIDNCDHGSLDHRHIEVDGATRFDKRDKEPQPVTMSFNSYELSELFKRGILQSHVVSCFVPRPKSARIVATVESDSGSATQLNIHL